jgi:acyl carrier protein
VDRLFYFTGKLIMNDTIREILAKVAQLAQPISEISNEDDLYALGLSSFASVQLMLGIEDNFDLEFPDRYLNRKSFASIKAIEETVTAIQQELAA